MSASGVTHANWAAVDTPEFNEKFEAAVQTLLTGDRKSWEFEIAGEKRAGKGYQERVSPGNRDLVLGS
jgi:hypothetical protein